MNNAGNPGLLPCGHSQWDSRRDCLTCLQFAVATLNELYGKTLQRMTNLENTLAYIATQESLTFAECSVAEDIVSRAKKALLPLIPSGKLAPNLMTNVKKCEDCGQATTYPPQAKKCDICGGNLVKHG